MAQGRWSRGSVLGGSGASRFADRLLIRVRGSADNRAHTRARARGCIQTLTGSERQEESGAEGGKPRPDPGLWLFQDPSPPCAAAQRSRPAGGSGRVFTCAQSSQEERCSQPRPTHGGCSAARSSPAVPVRPQPGPRSGEAQRLRDNPPSSAARPEAPPVPQRRVSQPANPPAGRPSCSPSRSVPL